MRKKLLNLKRATGLLAISPRQRRFHERIGFIGLGLMLPAGCCLALDCQIKGTASFAFFIGALVALANFSVLARSKL